MYKVQNKGGRNRSKRKRLYRTIINRCKTSVHHLHFNYLYLDYTWRGEANNLVLVVRARLSEPKEADTRADPPAVYLSGKGKAGEGQEMDS